MLEDSGFTSITIGPIPSAALSAKNKRAPSMYGHTFLAFKEA
jgi:hypothetical protein